MKPVHHHPLATARLAGRRGSVLIVVLWIAIGMVGLALYFADSMRMELRVADNRAAGIAADQAIEGAARYVSFLLSNYGTNGVMPGLPRELCAGVPVGDARFWIIGRETNQVPSGIQSDHVTFGLVDEASKLNLNSTSTNILQWLPNMTYDLVQAIPDWRSTNSDNGTQLTYPMAQPPYQCKSAPFETVDELRLVYGSSMDILVGEDINRNGILDPNEKDLNGNGQCDPGLLEYLTVYSREPNFNSDGTMRVNVNDAAKLRPLLSTTFGSGRASQILSRLGYSTRVTTLSLPGLLAFYLKSGLTSTEFAQLGAGITVGTSAYKQGRVNINTASLTVLTCLLGGDYGSAQQVVNYRLNNPNNLTSIAWIVDALGANNTALQTLAAGDYITTFSYQCTADIAAVGPYGRGYRRVKFIFDLSDGAPRVLYRQDLTGLGWALGEDVRRAVLAQNTQ
jgi:type II secretory pathway component PulK